MRKGREEKAAEGANEIQEVTSALRKRQGHFRASMLSTIKHSPYVSKHITLSQPLSIA